METGGRPAFALKRVRVLFHWLHRGQRDAICHVGQKADAWLRFGFVRRYRFFGRDAHARAQTVDPRELHPAHGDFVGLFLGGLNVGRVDL